MTMIEVKTADLIGPALDWAVGMAVDGTCIDCNGYVPRWRFPTLEASVWPLGYQLGDIERYQPSTAWSDGGPLIEANSLEITKEWGAWAAIRERYCSEAISWWPEGETILVAACRAIVAAKMGDTVQVPKELLP